MMKKLLNRLFGKPTEQVMKTEETITTEATVKVWKIVEGPYTPSDICDCEDCQEETLHWLVVSATTPESPDVLIDVEIYFPDFESAYQFKNTVNKSFNRPVEVEDIE